MRFTKISTGCGGWIVYRLRSRATKSRRQRDHRAPVCAPWRSTAEWEQKKLRTCVAKPRRGSDARRDLRKAKFTVKTQVASSRGEAVALRLREDFGARAHAKSWHALCAVCRADHRVVCVTLTSCRFYDGLVRYGGAANDPRLLWRTALASRMTCSMLSEVSKDVSAGVPWHRGEPRFNRASRRPAARVFSAGPRFRSLAGVNAVWIDR